MNSKKSISESEGWLAGFSRQDITPSSPCLLTGYGGNGRIWETCSCPLAVRVLALRDEEQDLSLLLAFDLCGLGRETVQTLEAFAAKRWGVAPERVVLNSSHNHSAPTMAGALDLYYDHNPDLDAEVEAYSDLVVKKACAAMAEAVENLAPATLSFGQGLCGFGVNRRRSRPGTRHLPGPVDQDVPVLAVHNLEGALRGLVFGYACHTTSLCGKDLNGDYSGWACQALEDEHPGAVALFVAGCGADINPLPRYTMARSKACGLLLTEAVRDTLKEEMEKLGGPLKAGLQRMTLKLGPAPDAAYWQNKLQSSARPTFQGMYRHQLTLLGSGKPPPDAVDFSVRIWTLGKRLTWVFLSGEVVVDYSHFLKSRHGWENTWVTGYCDELTPYIPSERVLSEGGYEGTESMPEYGYPAPFLPGLEAQILGAAREAYPDL